MTDARRLQYLDAIGIEAWVKRPAAGVPPRLRLGPGRGSVLLLCGDLNQTSSKLAADISRFLGPDAAWGWPSADISDQSAVPAGGADEDRVAPVDLTLEQAIGERGFTRVVFFGESLRRRYVGRSGKEFTGSAALVCAGEFKTLSTDGAAKKILWRQLSQASQSPPQDYEAVVGGSSR